MSDRRTVLVTGGAGYIGSHTVLALRDAGEPVVVLDDLSTGFRSAVPPDVPLIEGSCGDADLVAEALSRHRIGAIIHFAASIVVPDSVARPLAYYANNTANAGTLLDCAVSAGVPHFVFSSTAAVYGEPETSPITEQTPTRPINPYGRSKLMVEWMLDDVARASPLRYAALRYFNVAGADPDNRSGQSTTRATHLIKLAVQAALGRREGLDLYGQDYPTPDGTCIRDYVHVSDLAQAHLDALAALRGGGDNRTCNIGYGRGYSVREVIDVVKQISGVDFPVHQKPRRPGDPASLVAANASAASLLAWRPRFDDLETIVRHALAWERRLSR